MIGNGNRLHFFYHLHDFLIKLLLYYNFSYIVSQQNLLYCHDMLINQLRTQLSGCHFTEYDGKTELKVMQRSNIDSCFLITYFIHDGSGCNDFDDIPLHQSLCQCRILQLLNNCDFISFLNQSLYISLCGMMWNSTHRYPFFYTGISSCQNQIKLTGCRLCIFEKHFIKITETIEYDCILMLFF